MNNLNDVKPLTKLDQARMRALRNGIYHTLRRGHYEMAERLLNFLVIILGTTAAADGARGFGVTTAMLGGAAAVVGTIQLVWGPSSKARDHAVLQGKFFSLVARAEAPSSDDDTLASEIEQELAKLYADETGTMHAVNALAYNAAQMANGRPDETLIDVRWWERVLANVLPFSPDRFQKRKAARRAAAARNTALPAAEARP